ncbi:MAG: type III pantothenate kinase [Acutalibacteraceae bacterium]|nr:type III pantothenate kinase [Clostridiales bacterium]
MILVLDAGNTNITLGIYDDNELLFVSRLSTENSKTQDQFAIDINSIFALNNCKPVEFNGAILSSVVPEITVALKNAVEIVTGHTPLIIGPGIKTGLDIRVDSPAHLGADLVAGAVAAIAKYPLPCLVMDLGTATKISVIDSNSIFRGCTIAPGVEISAKALFEYASQLPRISLETPTRTIGTNNNDCIRAGIVYGTADMLDGMCHRIEKELGTTVKSIIATGGVAKEIVPHCGRNVILNPNLILEGLKIIYDKNQ